jgi:hypothetical protein
MGGVNRPSHGGKVEAKKLVLFSGTQFSARFLIIFLGFHSMAKRKKTSLSISQKEHKRHI